MRFKEGVKINGVKQELALAIMVTESVFNDHKKELVITSVMEGKHSMTSLHYVGYAFDVRTRHLTIEEKALIVKDMREYLTDEFDVVLEKDHIHVEFQPKRQD